MERALAMAARDSVNVLLIETTMTLAGEGAEVAFLFVPAPGGIDRLLRALAVS